MEKKATLVKPDLEFIKELQEFGAPDLKKCYQCATCTVVCPLSPMDRSFPRKEMIWAQWGLKDKLMYDIDIWLCHKCGQCTELCPRGAKPGELMAALRNLTFKDLVGPKFLGKWMSSIVHLPKLIAIPAILFLIIWFITGSIHGTPFPLTKDGLVDFSLIFPGDFTIDPIFGLVSLFVIYTFYKGIKALYKGFESQPKTFVIGYQKPKSFWHALWQVIKEEVLTHRKWKDCGQEESDEKKFKGHLLVFYGFVLLFFVTACIFLTHWGGRIFHFLEMKYPMPLYNPLKLIANIGAISLIVGLYYLTKRRWEEDKKDASTYYDWYLLGVIWGVAITGILSELFRMANVAGLAYFCYYLHLITVFMLIAYLPWSKLGHLVYRVFALAYARMIGRVSTEIEYSKNKLYVL